MGILIIIPMFRMAEKTLTWQIGDERLSENAQTGEFTLFHWQYALFSPAARHLLLIPLRNSLIVAGGSTALALLIGGSLAWLAARSDLPVRGLINKTAALPFIYSSWTLSLAWLEIFKNRKLGGGPGIVELLLGVQTPDWLAYGPLPIAICLALHNYIFPFLLLSNALTTLDSNLEEAGETLGASRWRILRKITFPMVLPAVLSSFVLTFADSVDAFGPAYLLGIPVRFYTLATNIRGAIVRGVMSEGFIIAFVLIAISAVMILINQKILGTRKSFQTISGKGNAIQLTHLGKWKIPISIVVCIFLAIIALVPLSIITSQTFLLRTGSYSPENLTLHYWIGESTATINNGQPGLIHDPRILEAAFNSLRLAFLSALAASIIGLLIGYAVVKGRGTALGKFLEQIAFLPYLMPGIAFGATYIAMFTMPMGPIPVLYGTFSSLVIVCVAKHITNASRIGFSTLMQVGTELEEAAAVTGAGWFRRILRIILPLCFQSFLASFILTFNIVMREFSLIILLVAPDTQVLISIIFQFFENAQMQMAYAVQVVLTLIMAFGNILINFLPIQKVGTKQIKLNIGW